MRWAAFYRQIEAVRPGSSSIRSAPAAAYPQRDLFMGDDGGCGGHPEPASMTRRRSDVTVAGNSGCGFRRHGAPSPEC